MTRLIRFLPSLFASVLLSGAVYAQSPGGGAAGGAGITPRGGAPAPTQATTDEAGARFKRGLELYEEQDFQNALIEFRRAYELQPSYRILYNLGQVCFQLTEYACALRNFEKYLKEGGPNVSSDRRAEVERDIAKLQTRIGRIEIVTNVPGVDISIDDIHVGKTPLDASVPVGAGRRKITATKEGRTPVTRIVEVAGTESTRVVLDMTSSVITVEARRLEPRWTKWSTVGVVAAGGLAAIGAVTGVLALKASDDLKDARFSGANPDGATEDKESKVKTLSLVTDVFLGAAVVTLGTTLALTFFRELKPEEADKEKEKEKETSKFPKLEFGLAPGRVSVGGRF